MRKSRQGANDLSAVLTESATDYIDVSVPKAKLTDRKLGASKQPQF